MLRHVDYFKDSSTERLVQGNAGQLDAPIGGIFLSDALVRDSHISDGSGLERRAAMRRRECEAVRYRNVVDLDA